MKFRKKPVVIEAVQLRWDTWSEMCKFADVGKLVDGKPEGVYSYGIAIGLHIPTLEGIMTAREGDWVIRGIKGELYPCKDDIFRMTYEAVEEPNLWAVTHVQILNGEIVATFTEEELAKERVLLGEEGFELLQRSLRVVVQP